MQSAKVLDGWWISILLVICSRCSDVGACCFSLLTLRNVSICINLCEGVQNKPFCLNAQGNCWKSYPLNPCHDHQCMWDEQWRTSCDDLLVVCLKSKKSLEELTSKFTKKNILKGEGSIIWVKFQDGRAIADVDLPSLLIDHVHHWFELRMGRSWLHHTDFLRPWVLQHFVRHWKAIIPRWAAKKNQNTHVVLCRKENSHHRLSKRFQIRFYHIA